MMTKCRFVDWMYRGKDSTSFGEKTVRALGENDFKELQHFLSKSPERQDSGTLHDTALAKFQTFYDAEILESGEPLNRLGAPPGPENVEMGLVMHCQSKEGEVGEFWYRKQEHSDTDRERSKQRLRLWF